MLHVVRASTDGWFVDNWGTDPSATPGTSVTPGASNAEGSWTQLLTALTNEAAALHVTVGNGATAGASKPHLLDIGIDPAGGTSYTALISNIICGNTHATIGQRKMFYFPIRVPAGATVAARIQGANATAGTVSVAIRAYGFPSAPHTIPVGSFSETIGTITNSNGVSFTPGNAADGSWTSLGTTTNPLWWWQVAYQIDNATQTAEYTYIDLAYGDGSNKHIIQRVLHAGSANEAHGLMIDPSLSWFGGYSPVPAGATLYVRGRTNNAPDTGYNAVAVGIGG